MPIRTRALILNVFYGTRYPHMLSWQGVCAQCLGESESHLQGKPPGPLSSTRAVGTGGFPPSPYPRPAIHRLWANRYLSQLRGAPQLWSNRCSPIIARRHGSVTYTSQPVTQALHRGTYTCLGGRGTPFRAAQCPALQGFPPTRLRRAGPPGRVGLPVPKHLRWVWTTSMPDSVPRQLNIFAGGGLSRGA